MRKNKEKRVFRVGCVIVLLAFIVIVLIWYYNVMKNELRNLVQNMMEEVSNQNVIIVSKEIESDMKALEEIADRVGRMEGAGKEEIVDALQDIAYRYSFKRMGYCLTDGTAYVSDGTVFDLSQNAAFKIPKAGETIMTDPVQDELDGEEIIVFCTGLRRGSETTGVVFATCTTARLREILAVSSFRGQGYSYIVQSDGGKVVDSVNPTSFQNMTNILKSMEEADSRNTRAVADMKALLESGGSGYVIFYNKIAKYMYATPLGFNGWYLIDVVPVDFLESTSHYIIYRTAVVCLSLVVTSILIGVLIMREDRRKKKQMQDILYVDELTGGKTYAKFKQDLSHRTAEELDGAALVRVDIRDFKLVNELFGYEKGDEALRYFWNAFQERCQKGEDIGRVRADCFIMLLRFETKAELERRILRIADMIQSFVLSDTSEYILSPVFGVYYIEKGKYDAEYMLSCVGLAHSFAKQDEDSIYRVYTDELREGRLRKKQLSDQLGHAYQNNEFVVYYQPKYESETQKLIGAEALVRWKKPDGELVPPGVFIPLAEESGFVRKLDEYIFREVCLAQRRWLDSGMQIVPISVNLSRKHFENSEFIDRYVAILQELEIPVEYVQLEITESAVTDRRKESVEIIERLHKLGFKILIDDFGTGYSSLMMLKSVPVDVMKLDKSFVDDFDDIKGEQIIRCVMRLAQNLQIATTAEGVETEAQFEFLRSIGCDSIQGYYFAKPMPEEEYAMCMERSR